MLQIKVRLDPETSKVTWTAEGDVQEALALRKSFTNMRAVRMCADQALFAFIERLFTRLKAAGLDESTLNSDAPDPTSSPSSIRSA